MGHVYRTHTHIKLFIKKKTRKLFSFHIWFPYCQMIDSSHTWRILAHLPQTRWSTHIDDTCEWWMRNSHSSWSFRCFFCCCCFIFHSCSYHNGVWNLRACSRTQFFCVFCWLIGCRKVYLNEIQQFFFSSSFCVWIVLLLVAQHLLFFTCEKSSASLFCLHNTYDWHTHART